MAALGKCQRCGKSVYPLEAATAVNKVWHKGCFKCSLEKKNILFFLLLLNKKFNFFNFSHFFLVFNFQIGETCGWQLTLTSYKAWEDRIYCSNHFPITGFGEHHVKGKQDIKSLHIEPYLSECFFFLFLFTIFEMDRN
jgi:hypothetical protein